MGPKTITLAQAQRQYDNADPSEYWESPDEDEDEEVEEEEEDDDA